MSKRISLQEYKAEKLDYAIITSKRIISYLEKIKANLNNEETIETEKRELVYLPNIINKEKIKRLKMQMSEILKEIGSIDIITR